MDVDTFISKYRPEWELLERATARGTRGLARSSGPEIRELVSLYLRVSGHLAEVQTRYRDEALRAYLNRVVARAHAALYASRPRTLAGFIRYFGPRYRTAIARTRPFIAAAAVVLIGGTATVALWVLASPDAQHGLLPPVAREAARRAGGTTVTGGVPSIGLSAFIWVNNVQVAFLAFALGITLGIGTLYVLAQNAILIGALAGATQAFGNGGRFWALVLPHGFLEITAIAIAAGAGLRIGWSLIAPGDRSRADALVAEARDAAVVVTGVIPAFLVAAAIEGFLTGSPLPSWLEIAIGAVVALGYVLLLFGPRRATAARTP